MAKFTYNNAKNSSIDHIPLELNCVFQPIVFYQEDGNPRCKLKAVDKPATKRKVLVSVCSENFQYTLKLQKHYYDQPARLKAIPQMMKFG